MTTCAPWRASASEAARPMPREPPVTMATLPVSSNISKTLRVRACLPCARVRQRPKTPRQALRAGRAQEVADFGDAIRVGNAEHFDALVDALYQASQHFAWADLECFDHFGVCDVRDRAIPQHR